MRIYKTNNLEVDILTEIYFFDKIMQKKVEFNRE